jgi:HNH endonuclease
MSSSSILFEPVTSTPEYREVPGFPNYRLGNDGSVWSKSPGLWGRNGPSWRRMNPVPWHPGGYLTVCLYRDKEERLFQVHQLILSVFAGPAPAPGMQVCHNNGNPRDNRVENLRWGTAKDNAADRRRHGRDRTWERHHAAKLTWAQVLEMRELFRTGRFTKTELARRYGVSRQAARDVLLGKTWVERFA